MSDDITITSITVERAYTINLGNFESAKVGGSFTADVKPGVDLDQAYQELSDSLENKLIEDMEAFGGENND